MASVDYEDSCWGGCGLVEGNVSLARDFKAKAKPRASQFPACGSGHRGLSPLSISLPVCMSPCPANDDDGLHCGHCKQVLIKRLFYESCRGHGAPHRDRTVAKTLIKPLRETKLFPKE